MKKLLFLFVIASVAFISCDKECDHDDLPCEQVDIKVIPGIVVDSLNARFPGVVVTKWFNKDNKGFCAHFIVDNKKASALFGNNGQMKKFEYDNHDDNHNGKHNDHHDDDGCECEDD